MVTAFDVAACILEKMGPVSHMKLQKLLYYAQAWSLVWEDKPLFPEPIQAWVNGPVVPELYDALKGNFTISPETLGRKGDPESLATTEKDVIDRVIEFYGPKNTQWLSDLTHMELPWQQARAGIGPGTRSEQEISLASMSEYYSGL